MNYVILDLEWNTAYSRKYDRYINEIIEIGAVKLNDKCEIISEYSSIIKPQIQKKLRSRVKQLTNITNDEVKLGNTFDEVIEDFSNWIGNEECIVLSWGNMDIRVMYDNVNYLIKKQSTIPFVNYYVDLQDYCMDVLKLPKSQQISLNNAADMLKINLDEYVLHRALVDSKISAICFSKVKDKLNLDKYVCHCNKEFYERLFFKPYIVKDLNSPHIDKSIMNCKCSDCGKPAKQLEDWHFINGYLRSYFYCEDCNVRYRVNIQFKKYFDKVNVKKQIKKISNQNENEIKNKVED